MGWHFPRGQNYPGAKKTVPCFVRRFKTSGHAKKKFVGNEGGRGSTEGVQKGCHWIRKDPNRTMLNPRCENMLLRIKQGGEENPS